MERKTGGRHSTFQYWILAMSTFATLLLYSVFLVSCNCSKLFFMEGSVTSHTVLLSRTKNLLGQSSLFVIMFVALFLSIIFPYYFCNDNFKKYK